MHAGDGEDAIEDYGDDEYFDNCDDLGDILTQHQRGNSERGCDDDVSIASDDVISIGSDVTSLNDDETYDRKSSVVDSLKEDFEKFRKMRKEKEKDRVSLQLSFTKVF